MFSTMLSRGRLGILGAAVVFWAAGPTLAAPPMSRASLPHRGVPHMSRPGSRPPHHMAHPGHDSHHHHHGHHYPYYGNGYDQGSGGSGGYSPSYSGPSAEEKSLGTLLTASGVPTDGVRPVWPLALRILPGQEAQTLRVQIDALLQIAGTQAVNGQPNTVAVDVMAQGTARLRQLLLRHREERGTMAQPTYDEAKRFLDKLATAQQLLRKS
jgi:hypothetical protein